MNLKEDCIFDIDGSYIMYHKTDILTMLLSNNNNNDIIYSNRRVNIEMEKLIQRNPQELLFPSCI